MGPRVKKKIKKLQPFIEKSKKNDLGKKTGQTTSWMGRLSINIIPILHPTPLPDERRLNIILRKIPIGFLFSNLPKRF